ncbi:hypothetical protein SAMN05421548_115137 [Paraburkholderia lycopersici]|uniref:Uncharacterized protein n=2 Tax=Paraburkholderia lycopersici TaxID=416944 RepID=A0A1G6SNE0_9BURK|nr:hypothetical protein SAMN05421548_115137 [Paraburkholderia lycopersici]
MIEGAAVGADTAGQAPCAASMRAQAEAPALADTHAARPVASASRPAAVRALVGLRARKRELVLLAVAAGCVIAFAWWLDAQLQPALVARERNEQAAEDLRERVAPCLPDAARSHTSWCGAITIPPPPVRPVTPLPLVAGAPAAFCTANGSPSC